MIKNKIYLVIFGAKGPNSDYTESKFRLSEEAKKTKWFNDIFVYDEKTIEIPKNKNLNGQGCGFWWWKAKIILQSFKKIEPDSIVLYLDAGCSININGVDRFNEYVKMCNDSPGFLGFGAGSITQSIGVGTSTDKIHTKKDLLLLLNCNSDKYLNSSQISGGTFFVKNNEFGNALIKQWEIIMGIDHFINNDISINDEYPEFNEHRHDQSVLSLLVKLRLPSLDNYLLDLGDLGSGKCIDSDSKFPIIQNRIQDSMMKKIKKIL
jgi:hypothetical protein